MHCSGNRGFTLLELSVVLLIISVVMGGMVLIFNQSVERRQEQETQEKMADIQKALLNYRRAFNHIPCPADATRNMDVTSNNYYGVEAANPGICSGGTPAANFSVATSSFTGDTTSGSSVITSVSSTSGLAVGTLVSGTGIVTGSYVVSIDSATQITISEDATATNTTETISYNTIAGGMVPTKALRLPDGHAIDGWGRRIMYMVDVNLTASGAFVHVPVTDTSNNRIKIEDASSNNKVESAVYLLLSYGKNGHGAYPRVGGTTRLTNYVSADSDELTNCHCSSTSAATTFSSSFVQKPVSDNGFDDILAYATRADMRGAGE